MKCRVNSEWIAGSYDTDCIISDVDGEEDDDDDDEDDEEDGEEGDDTEVGLSYLQKSGLEVTSLFYHRLQIEQAFRDIRLRPGITITARCRLHFSASFPLCPKLDVIHKSEVHNIAQHCRRRTEPWPQRNAQQNFAPIGAVVSEICSQTSRRTHRQMGWSQYSAPLQGCSKNTHVDKILTLLPPIPLRLYTLRVKYHCINLSQGISSARAPKCRKSKLVG